MRLISLGANQPSFKTIHFNPFGVSLILGKGSKGKDSGGSNGSGKTLALELLHLCLGCDTNSIPAEVRQHLADWRFKLEFSANGSDHVITRRGDGQEIILDDEALSLKGYQVWLNEHGGFTLPKDIGMLSFRSLITRFARRKDFWNDPIRSEREPIAHATLKVLYLLGIEPSLLLSKMQNAVELCNLDKALKVLKNNPTLRLAFQQGIDAETQITHLESEIERLSDDLAHFQVAEDYRVQENQANELTGHIRSIDQEIARLAYEQRSIEEALQETPDISKQELLNLYDGLKFFFKDEALAHLDAVEKFHTAMLKQRKSRLGSALVRVEKKIADLNKDRIRILEDRDKIVETLNGKKAFDEYAALSEHIRSMKEELATLTSFEQTKNELQNRKIEIRKVIAEEDAFAAQYQEQKPLARYSSVYSDLTKQMYPDIPSGLVLENNTGGNQIRFSLKVEMAGSNSAGIGDARIVCFDWLTFMYGQNHNVGFLWHDSSLFSDNDTEPRARWFSYVLDNVKSTGKQYIISLTHENFQSMKEYLPPDDVRLLEMSEILNLGNATDSEKLLGISIASITGRE